MVRRTRAVDTRLKDVSVAVKLRLMRMGKKKQPTYRVVAADSRSPRNGRFIEVIGTYDPRQEPSVVLIDTEKAADWIRKGAQPTETVARLIEVAKAQPAPAPAPEADTASS
jgi:small subunit ribosomal protein S16